MKQQGLENCSVNHFFQALVFSDFVNQKGNIKYRFSVLNNLPGIPAF